MKAAIFESFQGEITIKNVPDPTPNLHGAVIQVEATGLCRSDWHGWMGHDADIELPHVPGHEFAGVVAAVGRQVQNFQVGDRVTIPFVCGCGTCRECASGNHQVCDHQTQPGFTHWGSFAEYVAIDYADTNLVRLPESMDALTAATLGCRFITSYRAIVDQGRIQSGQYVVIHGCGGVGLSAIMIAHALGAQVIAVDIKNESLKLASDNGASHTINARDTPDLIGQIHSITDGGAHISVDALGSTETCNNSIASLRKRGKHIQIGLLSDHDPSPFIPINHLIANELEIIGSHGMQAFKYPPMMDKIISGQLQPQKLIKKKITLEEATQLLPQMNQFDHQGIMAITSF